MVEHRGKKPPAGGRPIRSYVIRGGRLTVAQAAALEELWPQFGLDADCDGDFLDFGAVFGRKAPVIIEIGFGDGEATWRMAQAEPNHDFIGVEVHQPGIGRLLMAAEQHGISNIRVVCADAVDFLSDCVPGRSLAGVRIYFPDPWPKKRHHKRRIIQQGFLELLAAKMQTGGVLHLATDWEPYAEHMRETISQSADFRNTSVEGDYCERPEWRPQTKYEQRGHRLGHKVRDLVYLRI
jgi:tRNA (guanine-N7-)-methyltransferase